MAGDDELSLDAELDQMEHKANVITYKNRGLSSSTAARIAPSATTGAPGARRPVHEIQREDIQRVDPSTNPGSRRITRQKSKTFNDQVTQEVRLKRAAGAKKNVKFGGMDDSFNITQNTPEEQSELGGPPEPDMQTSLM